ncbi:MAG: hypothetical protein KGH54_02425 [Candidatus Micrarchaeota archaeon]|nr:hypothetical protein [Candidatus Micrarchaeota archaeon]
MFARHYYLLLGILSLCLSYVLFTGQQYFSLGAMLGLFALTIISAALFILPHIYPRRIENPRLFWGFLLAVLALAAYECIFNLVSPDFGLSISGTAVLVAAATGISVAGIYYAAKLTSKLEGNVRIISVLGALAVVALAAYSVMYVINQVNWGGVDELVFNYYGAYLFVHGQDPYTASMQYALAQYNVQPTVQLNGQYDFAYPYPALSFVAFALLPLLGITNLLAFTYIVIFISIAAGFLLYRRSESNRYLLIPIAGWLVATFALVGTVAQYLAVSVFLLLAYLYRGRPIVSGILLGLGASTQQVAWFGIPFFYVLTLRERGTRALLCAAAASLAVFLAANIYFVAIGPAAIGNIFGIFGLDKLPFYGTNIMQLIVAFYPLPYWYSVFASGLFMAVMLALYFVYTKSLKPIIAIVPMMIFFLSWRNITIYGLPFIPILLATYFWRDHRAYEDLRKNRRPILYAVFGMLIVDLAVALAAHAAYAASPQHLGITQAIPIISLQNGYYGPSFGLIGIRVALDNTFDTAQNVSFYIVSRGPNGERYVLSQSLNSSMAHSSSNYTLSYPLQLINNNTQIEVFAFSQDYISSRGINFSRLGYGVPVQQNGNATLPAGLP